MWQQWSYGVLPVLVDAAIKGVIVLPLAWLLVLRMKRKSAAGRHAAWLTAMSCLVLLPLLSAALPSLHVLPSWCDLSMASLPEEPVPSADPKNRGSDFAEVVDEPDEATPSRPFLERPPIDYRGSMPIASPGADWTSSNPFAPTAVSDTSGERLPAVGPETPVSSEPETPPGAIDAPVGSANAGVSPTTPSVLPRLIPWFAAVCVRVQTNASPTTAEREHEIARTLAPLQRNPWSQWSPGTEVVREFVDDQREGFHSYVQPDLTYRVSPDGRTLTRRQQVDGKPTEQDLDISEQPGIVPSSYLHRVRKGVPAQLKIDNVEVDCVRFKGTLTEHVHGSVHATVNREWVLPAYPAIPLRKETNDNWWRVKSSRQIVKMGDREIACVVVENRMKMAGGYALETRCLSAEVPGHMVDCVKEIHTDNTDKPVLIHERLVAIRLPEHLRHWGGLYDRVGDKIVDAPAEDVKVAKGYVTFADKGKVHNGRRVTIMTAKQRYAAGEEVRVIHVLEAVEPGSEVFVMGPKTVHGEYVDGKDVTKDVPKPVRYDGRVLKSPAVDYNYAITKYTFSEPGKHTIQWKAAGPFDGEGLVSNVLTIEIVQSE